MTRGGGHVPNRAELHYVAPKFLVSLEVGRADRGLAARAGTAIEEIKLYLAMVGVSQSDFPVVVHHELCREIAEGEPVSAVEAGVPIALPLPVEAPMQLGMLPGGLAVRIVHTGSVAHTGSTYAAILEWADLNERELVGSPWEVQVGFAGAGDPGETGRAEVYWLVRQE